MFRQVARQIVSRRMASVEIPEGFLFRFYVSKNNVSKILLKSFSRSLV